MSRLLLLLALVLTYTAHSLMRPTSSSYRAPSTSTSTSTSLRMSEDEPMLRIGHGYDIHRLIEGTPLVIGGVTIPYKLGADAHSDGDAVYHR
jgi:hypothetical protein